MYEVSFVSSKNKPGSWSGVFGFRPDNEAELKSRGEILAIMSLGVDVTQELEAIGRLLFDALQESYFAPEAAASPLARIEQSVASLGKRLDNALEHEKTISEKGIDLECAILVLIGSTAYVAVVGEARVSLIRGEKVVRIDKSLQDPTNRGFVRLGSFLVKPTEDTVCLLTEVSEKTVGDTELLELAETLNLGPYQDIDDDRFSIALVIDEKRLEIVNQKQAEAKQAEEVAAATVDLEVEPVPEEVIENRFSDQSKEEEPAAPRVSPSERLNKIKSHFVRIGSIGKGKVLHMWGKVKPAAKSAKDKLVGLNIHGKAANTFSQVKSKIESNDAKTYQVLIANFVRRIRNFVVAISRFVRKNLLGMDQRQSIYLKGRRGPRNWRLIIVLAVVSIVILYSVISSAVESSTQNSLKLEAQKTLQTKNASVDQIETEVSSVLTDLANTTARTEKINQVTKFIDEVKAVDLSKIKDSSNLVKERQTIVTSLEEQIDRLRGVTVMEEPELIADLSVNNQGVRAVDIDYLNGNVYVADGNNNAIFKIPAQANATPVKFASEKLSRPAAIGIDRNGSLIVFDEDTENSIATVSLADGKVQKHTDGLNISSLGIPSSITPYRVGEEDRVYWIDTRTNDLKWVKRAAAGGYGTTVNVRRNDPDYAQALDVALFDGRIYVLSSEKGVLRYFSDGSKANRLVPDRYTLTGILSDDNLNDASAFEVTANTIYVADSKKQRIVALSRVRNGRDAAFVDFLTQFVYRGKDVKLKAMVDIVFDDKDKVLYVLDGAKVYRVKTSYVNQN